MSEANSFFDGLFHVNSNNCLTWSVPMSRIRRFYSSSQEFEQFHETIKMKQCPHCRQIGCLILHGYLYGYGDTDMVRRGRRIFCSNRQKKTGCGRTFSILMAGFIKHCMIPSGSVSSFLSKIAQGDRPVTAFRALGGQMNENAGYRILRQFRKQLPRIRTCLLKVNDPPGLKYIKNPAVQTILHLKTVFNGCMVSRFQQYFQISFL